MALTDISPVSVEAGTYFPAFASDCMTSPPARRKRRGSPPFFVGWEPQNQENSIFTGLLSHINDAQCSRAAVAGNRTARLCNNNLLERLNLFDLCHSPINILLFNA